MKIVVLISMCAMMLVSCEKNSEPLPDTPADLGLNQKTAEMIQTDNAFGIDLFKEILAVDDARKNVFISPTSIALALAMTYNGAEGTTKTEMESVLRKAGFTREEINAGYQSLIKALLSADRRVIMEIANSIWIKQGFDVLPEFVNTNQEYYQAEVNTILFNLQGKDIINQWVNTQTHGKIAEIVDAIPADAIMYLINAIYFKGAWKYEFDPSNTTPMPFFLADDEEVTADMMMQAGTFNYRGEEKFSMIELPYGRGNFSMVVLLPSSGFSVNDIVPLLTDENWTSWMSGFHTANLDLYMPKFKFEYEIQLNSMLSNMGMPGAFTESADFSGINGFGGIRISRVKHKTFVEVNEEGTEAAAVTSVEMVLTSMPTVPAIFKVDKPFIFAIRETTTGAILFIGKVMDPLAEE